MTPIILELNRTFENESTTFGTLAKVRKGIYKDPICNIIENKWDNNKQDISCIPPGIYTIYKGLTNTTTIDGKSFFIEGIVNRTLIVFHIGNTHLDTKGCPMPVSSFGRLTVKGVSILGGYSSKTAFSNLMVVLSEVEEATLIVTGPN